MKIIRNAICIAALWAIAGASAAFAWKSTGNHEGPIQVWIIAGAIFGAGASLVVDLKRRGGGKS